MTSLSELKVPGPTTTEVSQPFWDAAADGRLQVQHCNDCEQNTLYPRVLCPHCWSDNLTWQQVSGRASLKSFTWIEKPGHPGWQPVAPYVVGLVQLAEGPTMLSHILCRDGSPSVGDTLMFSPTDIGGLVLPVFSITD